MHGNTGKKLSEEHKEKLRQSNLGKKRSLITRMRISLCQKGKKLSLEHIEKIRVANAGKKRSELFSERMRGDRNPAKLLEVRKKISEALKGKKRPNASGNKHYKWRGGITSTNEAIRQSLEYRLWRQSIFKRDDYTCKLCKIRCQTGIKVILHADHIKPFAFYPELRFAIDNGRTLCEDCHKKTDTFAYNAIKNYRPILRT